jgi:hypothetical protein
MLLAAIVGAVKGIFGFNSKPKPLADGLTPAEEQAKTSGTLEADTSNAEQVAATQTAMAEAAVQTPTDRASVSKSLGDGSF